MNTQFKKGVLELIVLLVISKEDKYGYQLVNEVGKIVDVKLSECKGFYYLGEIL